MGTIHKSKVVKLAFMLSVLGLCDAVAVAQSPSPYQGHWGALITNGGVSFRVWAPHATSVSVAGSFNGWSTTADMLAREPGETNWWSIFKSNVSAGAQYKFVINGTLWRVDPWVREIAYSGGNANGVVRDRTRSWRPFERPHEAETVLYEMHVGTFNGGTFAKVAEKAEYLRALGINAVQLMPPGEFGGDRSWGYNPVGIYAPEATYGGYEAFRAMVEVLHEHGIAVYVDVVYNHIEGEVLWKWDGWSMGSHVCTIDGQLGEHGGIYYYDWTGTPPERWYTPWGKNRPNYSRPEVTNYLTENLFFWLEEMNCDGIRMDSTINMRTVNNGEGGTIGEALPMLRAMNAAVAARERRALMIAEDLQRWDGVTRKDGTGLGFDAQWNDYFVDTVRDEMKKVFDEQRSMTNLRHVVWNYENGRPFSTVKYSESHDDAANGQSRLNVEIDGGTGGTSYYAKKRSTLAGALALTAVGIPMLFQGQEFLEEGYFRDDVPLDWSKVNTYGGIWRLYRDLIHLRRAIGGVTVGLTGAYINVYCVDEANKLMAWHRRDRGGIGDDVVIVINASATPRVNYSVGMPQGGIWYCHFNSDWKCYDESYGHNGKSEIEAVSGVLHGQPYRANVDVPPYSCLVYSQAAPLAPQAAFSAWPTNGNRGLTVRFFDATTGTGTNWQWEFGDGGTSSAVNPVHAYARGGQYTVSLRVSGPGGQSTVVASNLVVVSEAAWVDGQNITGDFAQAQAATFQNTVTDWGAWNSLLAMRGTLLENELMVGISGSIERSPNRNGIVVFFDTSSGRGTNTLPAWLSVTNVAWRIKNMVGLRFDAAFTPEYALNINIDENGTGAYVDFSDLVQGTYQYWGRMQQLDTSYGYISNGYAQVAMYNQSAAGTSTVGVASYPTGVEFVLRLGALGVTTELCGVQALLINSDGGWSANQSLPPINGDANSYARSGPTGSKRYDLVPGDQFLLVGIPKPWGWGVALAIVVRWRRRG